MKVKTTDLKNIVTRVSHGASNNKLLPLTSLVEIIVAEGRLILSTTDGTNYFTSHIEVEGEDAFTVSVNVDMFSKLVGKITTEFTSIEALDNCLMVIGNGKYKLDLLLDENNNPVTFPVHESAGEGESGEILTSTVQKILGSNKASLSTEDNVMANYYCGETVVTSDRFKICQTKETLFELPQLIDPRAMELLGLFTSEKINYEVNHNAIFFDGDNEFLYAPIVPNIDKMPIEVINQLINLEITNVCTVGRDAILQILDRLSIFVSPYDKNVIDLHFGNDILEITSKRSNGVEKLEYRDGFEHPDFDCSINIEMLKSQIATVNNEEVQLFYGSDKAIKLVTDSATMIVALQQ